MAARVIPTTFSTALPAIPTITSPANAFEMCSASTAGSRAPTNQSETNAAADARDARAPPARARTAWRRGPAPRSRARAAARSGGTTRARCRRRRAGRSRRPPRSRPGAGSRGRRAGRRGRAARSRDSASRSSVAVSLGSRRRKRIGSSPAAREPATIASPRTSSALAKSEPRIDVWATTTSPAERAKRTMKSSGRLPSVDWRTPVTAGPKRTPTDSVATPINQASPARAAPASEEHRSRRCVCVVERAGDGGQRGGAGGERSDAGHERVSFGRIPSARTSPRASAPTRPAPCRLRSRAAGGAPPRPRAEPHTAPGSARAARPRPRRPPA